MKTITIEIEPDIDAYLRQNWNYDSSTSALLRRLLGLNPVSSSTPVLYEKSDLHKMLASTEFIYAKGVVGRFLVVLRWLHDQDPKAFAKVEGVKGRGRLYFARDAQTLEDSGRSVNPKQIPETPYWVITTTPTDLKQEILEQVMRVLGYGQADIRVATEAIAK